MRKRCSNAPHSIGTSLGTLTNRMNKNKTYFDDISCIRAILVISIVLGHAFAMYTGGLAWPLKKEITPIYFYKYINPAVISFHLQSFVFIAGFLFGSQMSKNSPSITTFAIKKTKRILLPMFIFGLLYLWLFNPEYFNTRQWIKCLCNGPGHLWFLPMLYLCYIISRVLWKTIKNPSVIAFVFLTSISLISWIIPATFNPGNVLFYFTFFVQGIWFFTLRNKIYIKYNRKQVLITLYIILIFLIVVKCWAYYSSFTGRTPFLVCVRYLLGIIGSITSMFTFDKIQNIGVDLSRFRWNGWYGVYIYHQFILMILYYKVPLITTNPYWLPIVSFWIAIALSVTISEVSLKTKIGRFLIG